MSDLDAQVRPAPVSEPEALHVIGDIKSEEEPSRSITSTTADAKSCSTRGKPATKPGAVSVAVEKSLSDSVSSATPGKDSKVRRSRTSTPGAVSVGPEEPVEASSTSLDTRQSADDSHREAFSITSQKRRNHKTSSQPGVVMVTNSTTSNEKKEKEKEALGRKKGTTPGVVEVTGSGGGSKETKSTKGLSKSGTKPGVVSVAAPGDHLNSKKSAGLKSKVSKEVNSDPSMDTSEVDQTEESTIGEASQQPTKNKGLSGSEDGHARSKIKTMPDPPKGFPNTAPPISNLQSTKTKAKKGFLGGLFKKKGKRQNQAVDPDLVEYENELLTRIGSTRPMPEKGLRRSMQSRNS